MQAHIGLALSLQFSKEGAVLLFGLAPRVSLCLVELRLELPSCSNGPLSPGESIPLAHNPGRGVASPTQLARVPIPSGPHELCSDSQAELERFRAEKAPSSCESDLVACGDPAGRGQAFLVWLAAMRDASLLSGSVCLVDACSRLPRVSVRACRQQRARLPGLASFAGDARVCAHTVTRREFPALPSAPPPARLSSLSPCLSAGVINPGSFVPFSSSLLV